MRDVLLEDQRNTQENKNSTAAGQAQGLRESVREIYGKAKRKGRGREGVKRERGKGRKDADMEGAQPNKVK